jgi:hypothetical protein
MSTRCQSNNIHKEEWSLQIITKVILQSSVKYGSTIKNRYCISSLFAYTIEGSVFSCNISIPYFILWPGCSMREISFEVVWCHIQDATYLSEQLWKKYLLLLTLNSMVRSRPMNSITRQD